MRLFSNLPARTIAEIPKLPPKAIQDKLSLQAYIDKNNLEGWKINDSSSAIERQLQFSNFVEAMAFMNSVGAFAERIQHHPDWYNVYNKIRITLNTHDAPGITLKDFYLAKYINMIYQRVSKTRPKELNRIITISDEEYLEATQTQK